MSHPALRLTREAIRSLNLRHLFIQIGFLTVLCWLTAATANAANRFSVASGNWNFVGRWAGFRRSGLVSLLFLAGLFLFVSDSALAVTKTSTGSGNWNTAGTWSPSGVPASGDDVIIANGHTVTVNGSFTCATLTFNSGNSPTGVTISGTNSLTVIGAVTMNAPSDGSSARILAVGAGTFSCASLTMANVGGGNDDIIFSISTGSATVSGGVTMNGSSTENFINLTSTGTLNLGGSISGGSLNPGTSSTVVYNQAGAQSIDNVTYNNLTLSGSGAKTLSGNATVNGTLSIQGTATFALGGNTLTYGASAVLEYKGSAAQTASTNEFPSAMSADVIIDNTSGVALSATARTLSGNLTLTNGTFAAGTNLTMGVGFAINRSAGSMTGTLQTANAYDVNYTGNSKTTGSELSGSGFRTITVNLTAGQTLTLDQNRAPDGNLTVTSGIFDLSTFTINRSAAGGTITVSNSTTLKIGGTNTFPTNYTTHTLGATSTVEYGGANQTVTAESYGHLTLSGSGTKTMPGSAMTIAGNFSMAGTASATAGNALTVNGDVSIGASGTPTFNASTFTHNVKGNWTFSGGTFTASTGTINFNGTSAQTIGGTVSTTFNNLTINNTAGTQPGVTLGIDTTVGGTLTLTTDLSATGGTLTHTGGATACSGNGDLVGIVKRTTIAVGTTYCFGNSLNTIQFNSGTPSSPTMTVSLVKGSLPGNISNAVNRLYTLEPTGMAAFSATVQLRYLPGELGVIPESNLKLWRDTTGTGNWVEVGGTVNVTNDYVNVAGVTAFSPWVFAPPSPAAPTAVRMRGVQTVATADGVELRWRTGHEVDNLGFRIYREENGQRTLITKNVIAGSSLAVGRRATLTTGRSYRWTDEDGSANSAYWLEDIDLNGTHTLHGPFTPFPGPGASQNKGGKKSNRSAPNPYASQNSITLETMSRQAAQEIRATHEVTPVGALPGSYLGTAVRNAKAGGPKDSEAATQPRMLGNENAVKLTIKQEGWYRVMQPDLLAAGLDPQANPRRLKLYVDGIEVPIYVTGAEDGRFDPADSVEFYAMGLDTPVTDARVYWLLSDKGAGARVRKLVPVNGAPAGSGFMQTVERRDRETYMATLLNGAAENFFGAIVTPTEALDQTLLVPSVDRSAPANATLEIALQGITTGSHVTGVILNGVPLGSVNFNGQAQGVRRFTVPQTQLLDGANTVTLQNAGDDSDYSLVAYLRLTYPRAYRADSDALTLNAQAFQRVTINGFTDKGVRVFDVTDERNVVELETLIKQEAVGFSVTTTPQGNGQRRLLALGPSRLLIPAELKANRPSNWLTKGNRADLLLITHNTLAAQFSPLVALRRSQGWRVETVDIEDVYDEISFGHKTASGLGDFLAFTATFWNRAPKYVLLGGDASYDPRNYTNNGNSDLVPTRLVDAGTLETASDDALVDFDGDGLPDLTVGRLPARTPAEAQRMVERLLSYDNATPSKETVLVADQNIGYNFETLINSLQTQVPIGQTATMILRSQNNDATTRANLMAALNRGPRLANYFGHGSFDLWNGDILTAADASALQNGNKSSVYLMMTCLTGYFLEPGAESLAEALLKNINGGAIAVWAGTGYTEPDPQEVINKSVFPNLFKPGQLLGEALRQAKSVTTDRDTRLTWIFFGDPTMRLR